MPASFDARQAQTTLFDALVDASRTYGAKKAILEDQERSPLSYTDLIRASFALGRKIAGFTAKGERVGLMLPSSSAGVVTFFALHAFGRVPTMPATSPPASGNPEGGVRAGRRGRPC